MSAILSFLIGAMFGACVGVTVMCMLQINSINKYERKSSNEKKKHSEDNQV